MRLGGRPRRSLRLGRLTGLLFGVDDGAHAVSLAAAFHLTVAGGDFDHHPPAARDVYAVSGDDVAGDGQQVRRFAVESLVAANLALRLCIWSSGHLVIWSVLRTAAK